jgi:hypothetical protein
LRGCGELSSLCVNFFHTFGEVFSSIGRNLRSLRIREPTDEMIKGILDLCGNLEYLQIDFGDTDDREELEGSLKSGLNKLAKLKVGGKSVRLGSDWEGYGL